MFAVQNEHSALDIVQDSMIKLSEKYGDKPIEELPLLFQRILQNTIRDYYRRQKSRNSWLTLFSSFGSDNENEDEFDLLELITDEDSQTSPQTPEQSLQQNQVLELIEEGLINLPTRQREAFLLRYWEGMDTSETAEAMGCTEGSVKTHCSRAAHALAAFLEAKGIKL